MAVVLKTPGGVQTTVGSAATIAQKKGLVESSSVVLIGSFTSTGAPFSRSFPTITAANQWLATGAAADIEITRVESINFVQ